MRVTFQIVDFYAPATQIVNQKKVRRAATPEKVKKFEEIKMPATPKMQKTIVPDKKTAVTAAAAAAVASEKKNLKLPKNAMF